MASCWNACIIIILLVHDFAYFTPGQMSSHVQNYNLTRPLVFTHDKPIYSQKLMGCLWNRYHNTPSMRGDFHSETLFLLLWYQTSRYLTEPNRHILTSHSGVTRYPKYDYVGILVLVCVTLQPYVHYFVSADTKSLSLIITGPSRL